jgi:hypothetical protein
MIETRGGPSIALHPVARANEVKVSERTGITLLAERAG